MPNLKGLRCVVSALLSARVPNPDGIVAEMEREVKAAGGEVVARLVQRRGVYRSKRPGGSQRMEQPLTQRALFGTGKIEELIALVNSLGVDVVLIHNSLTAGQRTTLARLTCCKVFSFLDDFRSSENDVQASA